MQYNTRKLLLERILMVIASHKVHTISLFVANHSIKILHIHFITIYYEQMKICVNYINSYHYTKSLTIRIKCMYRISHFEDICLVL